MPTSHATDGIDEDLRGVVEKAFPEVAVDVVPEDGDKPTTYRSEDVHAAWKRMHDAAHGREVPILLEMLDGTWLRGEERWKAVTFLSSSLLAAEAHPSSDAILRALAENAAVRHRSDVPNDAVRIQDAALQAIMESTVETDQKWGVLLTAVQNSRSHFVHIARKLSGLQPSGPAAADAYPILVDAMLRSERAVDLDAIAQLVTTLDVRGAVADVRRLLLAASSNLSARAARILADWGDGESLLEIRRAIDQYSTANDPNVDILVESLLKLEGTKCDEYLAEVFRAAPPGLQEHLLLHALRDRGSAPLVRAVRDIVGSTTDVELKAVAANFLESAKPPENDAVSSTTVRTDTPQDPAGRSHEEPADKPAPETTDQWQPSYEGTQAPASAAPSPPPTPVATQGSWQPEQDEPQAGAVSEERARRLAAEAEALAQIRALAAEAGGHWQDYDPGLVHTVKPIAGMSPDRLVSLVTLLFALAAAGTFALILLTGSDEPATDPSSPPEPPAVEQRRL